jgi:hypothetical protein
MIREIRKCLIEGDRIEVLGNTSRMLSSHKHMLSQSPRPASDYCIYSVTVPAMNSLAQLTLVGERLNGGE